VGWPFLFKPPLGTPLDGDSQFSKGLVGCWLFNDSPGVGGTTYDLSGYGNHGTLSSGVDCVFGRYGSALKFVTADSDRIDATISAVITYPWSLLCDVDITSIGEIGVVFSLGDSGGTQYSGLYKTLDDLGVIRYQGTSRIYTPYENSVVGDKVQWCGVFISKTEVRVYINGVYRGTDTNDTGAGTTWNRATFGVSADSTPYSYSTINISHGLLYNRALTAGEVASLYARPFQMFAYPRPYLLSYSEEEEGNAGIMTPWGGYWGPTY
jgi:hypothetical protein